MKTLLSLAACACLSLALAPSASAMSVSAGPSGASDAGSQLFVSGSKSLAGFSGIDAVLTIEATNPDGLTGEFTAFLDKPTFTTGLQSFGPAMMGPPPIASTFTFPVDGSVITSLGSDVVFRVESSGLTAGTQYVLTLAQVVPEPTTMAMLAIGGVVCGGGAARRRLKKA